MSRPSTTDSQQLERLENVSALHLGMQQSIGVLSVRLRQIARRAEVSTIARFVRLAEEELARLADDCDDAQAMVCEVLAVDQQKRTGGDE